MNHPSRLIVVGTLLLALVGCRAPTDHPDAATTSTLQLYNVPAAQTDKLAAALGNALGSKASITSPAPGKLLVFAPGATQASVGSAIAALGKTTTAAAAPAQVNLRFWIVDGVTGNGADDAALKPLSTSLDALRQTIGPVHFRVDQVLATAASSGRDGSISTATDGGYLRSVVFAIKAVHGSKIDLWVSYDDSGQGGLAHLKTQIEIESGHYVVLGQAPGACSPALPGKTAPPCPVKPAMRLLIVRADRPSPKA